MLADNRAFKLNRGFDSQPKLKRNHMNRPHLLERLDAACEDSVAVVVAPPGYGKSSLVAEWCQILLQKEEVQVHRLCMPKHCDGNDVVTLLNGFLDSQAELSQGAKTYCILEDAHNLKNGQLAAALDCVAALRSMDVRVVVTAAAWSYALLGLCASVEIAAFERDFLSFSHEETSLFIRQNAADFVSKEYIEAVYEFTQGWPAGVCLLSVETDRNIAARSFAQNKYVHGYFSSLVDETCDEATTEFLFTTSYLDELRPDLCAHVMNMQGTSDVRPEAQAAVMVEGIEKLGLFLHRDTNDIDSTARYEKPFRLWLQSVFAMSQPVRAQEANRAASKWYADRQDDVQAIKHLLMSGDAMSNFDDVRAIAEIGKSDRDTQSWLRWISSLSREDVVANPALDVLAGWFFIRSGQSREAAKCVAMGNAALVGNPSLSEEETALIRAHLQCIEAKCLNMSGNDRDYIDAFDELMAQSVIADNIGLRCVMTYSLAESLERLGVIGQSQGCYREAITLSAHCGDVFALGLSAYSLARRKIEEGDLYEAEQLCRANMEACTSAYRGLLYVLIAHVNMLAYRFDEVKEALDEARAVILAGNVDFVFDFRIAESIIDEQAGRIDEACSSIMHCVILAKQNQVHQRSVLMRLQIRWAYLLYRKGDYRRCKDVLEEIERSDDSENTDTLLKARAIRIRLELADGDVDDARKDIANALEIAQKGGCVTRSVELHILESQMHAIAGEGDKAFLRMADALDDGARCGLKGLFVREGRAIVDILNESLSKRKLKRSTRRFCEDVLAEIDHVGSGQRSAAKAAIPIKRDMLTKREQQVLDLLNKGMSRKEVADELNITYNTVKVHVCHIYEKLGVDNKLDAFHAAREPKGL